MKVAMVTPYSPRTVTGVGTYIIDLCKELVKNRIDFYLIAPAETRTLKLTRTLEQDRIFFEIKVRRFAFLKSISFIIGFMKVLFKQRNKFDVIHCYSLNPVAGFCIIAGRILNKPVITTVFVKLPEGESRIKRNIQEFFTWLILNYSDEIAFETRDAKSAYGSRRGVIVPAGMDTGLFKPNRKIRAHQRKKLSIGGNEHVILFTGRLVESKGLLELMEAYRILKIERGLKFKLILIGNFESLSVEKIIHKYKNDPDLIHMPPMSRAEIRNVYNTADVFVLPSYWEGVSSALMEAMAAGLAPVVSNVGGNVEIVKNKKNGLVVEPRSPRDLAAALELLCKNEGLKRKFAKNARKTVVKNFNLKDRVARYMELYAKMIAELD